MEIGVLEMGREMEGDGDRCAGDGQVDRGR